MDANDKRDVTNDGVLDNTDKDFVSHENTGGEQALGAGAGAAVGAAWGTLGGPIGTIIGGLAGAVGGWWAARSATEQHLFNLDDDNFYRSRHDALAPSERSGRYSYDDVRPAYQIGHLAGANPDYSSRSFSEIEPHLKGAYSTSAGNSWDDVRGYASEGYDRGRSVASQRGSGDTADAGMDRERALRSEGGVADRVADAADDLKDRVDGNPASRPGRDMTDRPER